MIIYRSLIQSSSSFRKPFAWKRRIVQHSIAPKEGPKEVFGVLLNEIKSCQSRTINGHAEDRLIMNVPRRARVRHADEGRK